MLLLAFALASATMGPPPAVQRAQVQRAKTVKKARLPVRARPVTRVAKVDPNERYRLTGVTTPQMSGKDLVMRPKGMACGTTGAPVCPSNGVTFLDTAKSD